MTPALFVEFGARRDAACAAPVVLRPPEVTSHATTIASFGLDSSVSGTAGNRRKAGGPDHTMGRPQLGGQGVTWPSTRAESVGVAMYGSRRP